MQNVDLRKLDEFRSQVILEPLKRGFGHTLGNALRRVLLSSMKGCAVTEVVIKGVKHEYSAVEGVQEDVINILLNLKGIRFQLKGASPKVELTVSFKGPGVLKAKDIKLTHDVELLNPEHVIAHVTHDKALEMTLLVESGEGYVPAGRVYAVDGDLDAPAKKASLDGNVLFLDASFSPVRRVAYHVENARVEQRTDFDRLVLDIETNATISPEEAVREAAAILQNQFAVFSGLANVVETQKKVTSKAKNILDASIDELEITVRSANVLKSENIYTVKDLVSLSEADLMNLPNLGKKSLVEILEVLESQGLQLGSK